MRAAKTIVFGAAIFLLASLVIHIILAHNSLGVDHLQDTQAMLDIENKYIANDLRKYLENEITGAEVIECIRTFGETYSIDVKFPKKGGGFVTRTISDVSNYLDPMNQVDINGQFNTAIGIDGDAWIDSNVKYIATYKKSGSAIVGLQFEPAHGQESSYDYNGITKFAYFTQLQELSQNYKLLSELQSDLDYKLEHILNTDIELGYANKPLNSRIERLYYNYAQIYFYYGVNIDDGWGEKSQSQRNQVLQELTNRQVMKFFRPEWGGEEVQDIWNTKLPDLNPLAKPMSAATGYKVSGYPYEITNTSGDSVMTVIQQSIIDDILGDSSKLSYVQNNNREWMPLSYLWNDDQNYLKMSNGMIYDFVIYDENLNVIKSHFTQEHPSKIKIYLQNALQKLDSVNKDWNKWNNTDREKLRQARSFLIQAREEVKDYYDSYILCRQACESLKNKYKLPSCVEDIYRRSVISGTLRGDYRDEIGDLATDSYEIIEIDSGVEAIINNTKIDETNFFGSNDNAYLNTSLVVMNQSVDVSALRGASSADNDYKDYIDNAIKEIDALLAREVD